MPTQQRREEEADHESQKEECRTEQHHHSRREPATASLAPVELGLGVEPEGAAHLPVGQRHGPTYAPLGTVTWARVAASPYQLS